MTFIYECNVCSSHTLIKKIKIKRNPQFPNVCTFPTVAIVFLKLICNISGKLTKLTRLKNTRVRFDMSVKTCFANI